MFTQIQYVILKKGHNSSSMDSMSVIYTYKQTYEILHPIKHWLVDEVLEMPKD